MTPAMALTMTRRRAAVAGALVLAVVAACVYAVARPTTMQVDPAAGAPPEVRALEPLWRADWADGDEVTTAVLTDAGLVAVTDRAVVGADPATGEERWTVRVRGLCRTTEQPDDDGLLAVVSTGAGPNAPCRRIGVVDTERGRWLWQARLPKAMETFSTSSTLPLTAGGETVSVVSTCCYQRVFRYDLRSGEARRTIDPDVTGWGGWATVNGDRIATASGLGPDDRVRVRMLDADTGRELWRREVVELVDDNTAGPIVSTDPLVMMTSQRGHPALRLVDPRTGEPGRALGPQYDDSTVPDVVPLGEHDGLVLGAVGMQLALQTGLSGVTAYDPATGEEVWDDFPAAGSGFAGFEETPVGTGMVVANGAGPLASEGAVVTRHAVTDPERYEVLGAVEAGAGTVTMAGGLLLVGEEARLAAYDPPDPGEGQDVEVTLPEQSVFDAFGAPGQPREEWWEADDVRPEDMDTCRASTELLRSQGFHALGLAPRAGCRTFERQEPMGLERSVELAYEVGTPARRSTASERASATMGRLVRKPPFGSGRVEPAPYRPLEGVGDEAFVSITDGPGTYGEVHLTVRVRNLLVRASVRGDDTTAGTREALVPTGVLEDGALDAVEELLAQAGLDLDRPDRAGAGPYDAAPLSCAALDPTARLYAPDGPAVVQASPLDRRGRLAGCAWGSGDDAYVLDDGERIYSRYARVTAYAMEGSRFGATGTERARDGLDALRRGRGGFFFEKPEPVPGLGDEALLFPATGDTSEATVVVRVGNLLLSSTVNDQADPDLAARDAAAIDLAGEVVDAAVRRAVRKGGAR